MLEDSYNSFSVVAEIFVATINLFGPTMDPGCWAISSCGPPIIGPLIRQPSLDHKKVLTQSRPHPGLLRSSVSLALPVGYRVTPWHPCHVPE